MIPTSASFVDMVQQPSGNLLRAGLMYTDTIGMSYPIRQIVELLAALRMNWQMTDPLLEEDVMVETLDDGEKQDDIEDSSHDHNKAAALFILKIMDIIRT